MAMIGDEAAAGHGASKYNGWAAQLGKLLNEKFGYGFHNNAEVGLALQDFLRLIFNSF